MNFKMYFADGGGAFLSLLGVDDNESFPTYEDARKVARERARECIARGPDLDWTGWRIEICEADDDGYEIPGTVRREDVEG